ncbi:MAG: metal ABC transporter ATP-binding protein [Thermofilaceae archaeon]
MHGKPTVEVRDLEFAYGDEVVISSSSLSVEGPGLVTLLGPNGAGKTTFFKLLLGILKPLRGSVLLNGEDVTGDPVRAGVHASYVPQLSAMRRDLPMTALEAIEAALTGKLDGRERRERALKALSLVGAEQLAKRKLSEMSGGQLQRVMIARALARGTPILLMDEPFSGIDPRGREDLADLISDLAGERLILLSSHDPIFTLNKSKLVVVFNRGVRAIGSPRDVYRLELLREAYGPGVLLIEKCLHVLS